MAFNLENEDFVLFNDVTSMNDNDLISGTLNLQSIEQTQENENDDGFPSLIMPQEPTSSENSTETTTTPEEIITVPDSISRPVIRNVVCNVKVDCALDPKFIAMRTRNSEFNPKRFPAVILRIQKPKTTNLIFPGGRIVCVGCLKENDGRKSLRTVCRILQKLGYEKAKFENFKVQNIIANCQMGFPIRLEGLHIAQAKYCHFEPEVFSGLIYRMLVPKVCLLIFVSGRIVFTGAKKASEILQSFNNIYPILLDFKIEDKSKKEDEEDLENEDILQDLDFIEELEEMPNFDQNTVVPEPPEVPDLPETVTKENELKM